MSAQQEFWSEATLLAQTINERRAKNADGGAAEPGSSTAEDDWALGAKILRGTRIVYGYRELFYVIAVVLILLAIVGAFLMSRELFKG